MYLIQLLEEFTRPEPLRNHNQRLTILFIATGSGKCICNGEPVTLRDQAIYTGFADCFQQVTIDEGTTGYRLTIDPLKWETGGFVETRTSLRLTAESCEEIDWLMRRIEKRSRLKEKSNIEIVHTYISLLLLHLRSETQDEGVFVSMNRKGALLKGFFGLLEEDYRTGKTVDYYADKLCVTPKHLTNVIKDGSGFPTSYHIHQRIILQARRMARISGASLKEIAGELGYEDFAAFSKLFKRITGQNFSVYKSNLKLFIHHYKNR